MKRFGFVPVAVMLLTLFSGCTLDEKNDKTPTATETQTPAPVASASAIAGLDPVNSQTVTDGICTMLMPDDWTNSGNGRGFTSSGARFILFGNIISSDAEWTAAINIIATVAAGQHVKPEQTADSISYLNNAGTGYEIRRRIADRYCDFSVTSSSAVSDEERATWLSVGASMGVAPGETATP